MAFTGKALAMVVPSPRKNTDIPFWAYNRLVTATKLVLLPEVVEVPV